MSLGHLRPLFVCSFLLLLLAAAASASAGGLPGGGAANAVNPYLDDPHSSAYLNRAAARNPMQSPPPPLATPRTILPGAVNDPGADATAQDTQSETSLTASGKQVVVGFNDSGSDLGGASKFTGYSHSKDNGTSFTDRGALPTNAFGDAGDPNLATSKASGDVFFSTLAFNVINAIPVFRSTDHGRTFGAPVNGIPGGKDLDKDWMAIDNFAGTGNGNIYLCATDFGFDPARVVITHSSDGGATFTPNGGVVLSNSGQSQGCSVAVGPDHAVYVSYFRGNASNALYIRRSVDGGVTFGGEHQIAVLANNEVNGDLDLNGGFRTNSFPALAVSPATGALIVTYNDNTAPGNADVYATTSIDGGAIWSTPVVVNSDKGRDQYLPAVAIGPNGKRAMFGYYSRADDPANLEFHRRARIENLHADGSLTPSGRSFRLGPNNPPAIGQDPVVNSVYMGDYDQIVAPSNGAFYSSWADDRSADAFHAHQPDVGFAAVRTPQPSTDLRVTMDASPATIDAGQATTMTAHVRSVGGTADDVVLNISPVDGLTYQSVASPGNHCRAIDRFIGCTIGDLAPGEVASVKVTAVGGLPAKTRTATANATTSSIDSNPGNDTGSVDIVVNPGATKKRTYSSGNLATPINDNSTVDVPLAVGPGGAVADVDAYVRLNHTFDADIDLSLISPLGTAIDLSSDNGGIGNNYGTGANDCSGTATRFNDGAPDPITAGKAPFAGEFRPEEALSLFDGEEESGIWTVRVTDDADQDTGTLGCVELRITRFTG